VAAHGFIGALEGIRHGGATNGPLTMGTQFSPAACLHHGDRFTWATPAEVERRIERIILAATPKRVERGSQQRDYVRF
jgi:hypothetical protein